MVIRGRAPRFSSHYQDSDDEPQVGKDVEAVKVKCAGRFRQVVRRLIDEKRKAPASTTVSLRVVGARARRRFKTAFLKLESPEEQSFIASVLVSLPLMMKATKSVWSLFRPLRDADMSPGVKASLTNAAQQLHLTKVHTARHCWQEHIQPCRDKLQRVETLYSALKEQFNLVRSQYLKEVATLRDSARARADLAAMHLTQQDVREFYDPVNSLTQEELDFAGKVITEKLKMILEAAPDMRANGTQVAALLLKSDTNEVQRLRAAMKQRVIETEELKRKVRELQDATFNPVSKALPTHQGSSGAEKQIEMLESKIQELREQLRDSQKESKAMENLKDERQELQQAYQDEAAERSKAEQMVADLMRRLQAADEKTRCTEESMAKLSQELDKSRLAIESLNGQVARQKKAFEAAQGRRQSRLNSGKIAEFKTFDPNAEDQDVVAEVSAVVSAAKANFGLKVNKLVADGPGTCRSEPRDDDDLLLALQESEQNCHELEAQIRQLKEEKENLEADKSSLCKQLGDFSIETNQEAADEAFREAMHLSEISQLVTCSAEDMPAEPATPEELQELQAQAELLAEEHATISKEAQSLQMEQHALAVSGQADCSRALELKQKLRSTEFELFRLEILEEICTWSKQFNGEAHAASSRSLFKRLELHISRLSEQLESSATKNVALTRALSEVQSQTIAAVEKLKKVPAVRNDALACRSLGELETSSRVDVFQRVQEEAKAERERLVASISQRLNKVLVTKRTVDRLSVHVKETRAKLLPVIKFDRQYEEEVAQELRSTSLGNSVFSMETQPLSLPQPLSLLPEPELQKTGPQQLNTIKELRPLLPMRLQRRESCPVPSPEKFDLATCSTPTTSPGASSSFALPSERWSSHSPLLQERCLTVPDSGLHAQSTALPTLAQHGQSAAPELDVAECVGVPRPRPRCPEVHRDVPRSAPRPDFAGRLASVKSPALPGLPVKVTDSPHSARAIMSQRSVALSVFA